MLLDLRYSSDLVAVEFHLFIPWRDRMQGRCYADVKVPWNALCQVLQRKESKFCCVLVHATVQRWKRIDGKYGDCAAK